MSSVRTAKTFFGFYIGAQDPYNGFVDDNKALDEELTDAGTARSRSAQTR